MNRKQVVSEINSDEDVEIAQLQEDINDLSDKAHVIKSYFEYFADRKNRYEESDNICYFIELSVSCWESASRTLNELKNISHALNYSKNISKLKYERFGHIETIQSNLRDGYHGYNYVREKIDEMIIKYNLQNELEPVRNKISFNKVTVRKKLC